MKFREQDIGKITTVDQLQEAMFAAGIQAFDYVVWDHQRALMGASGAYVVTPVSGGYRLTNEERSSVDEVGIYTDQAEAVRTVVALSDPSPPQTSEEKMRMAAASRESAPKTAAHRAELDAQMHQLWKDTMRARAEAAVRQEEEDPADEQG